MAPITKRTVEERFWAKVRKTEGCWLWTASTVTGYGYFWDGDRQVYAHRFAYELLIGPIPEGLSLDHLCHNRDQHCAGGDACLHRRCVKAVADEQGPAHLEPVTQLENILRGKMIVGEICHRGHSDWYIKKPDGRRRCRQCKRLRDSRDRAKRREKRR